MPLLRIGTLPGMAGKRNLTIEQGTTFRKSWTWRAGSPSAAVDLTGCTARMQIRAKVDSAAILLELTTENNRIVLGGVAGTIDLIVSAADTAALAWKSGAYDLEIVFADGTVRRLLKGSVFIDPEVTR